MAVRRDRSKQPHQVVPETPSATRQHFEGTEVTKRDETAAAAEASRATAMVQARFVMAERRPRNWEDVRERVLHECKRPGFARKAVWRRIVGREKNEKTGAWEDVWAEGPTIRLLEAAHRYAGNMDTESRVTYEDETTRKVAVLALDFETNASHGVELVIEKTVERRSLRDGQTPLSSRQNSRGDTVYRVEASEQALLAKQNADISKAVRTLLQRLTPADLLEDWQVQAKATTAADIKADPDKAKRDIMDAFAGLAILPSQLELYLGKPMEQATTRDLEELRGVYVCVRDMGDSWAEILTLKRGTPDTDAARATQERTLNDKLEAAAAKRGKGSGPTSAPWLWFSTLTLKDQPK